MVEFVYEDPKQGGVKDVYFSPDRSYVVAFYRKQLDTAGRERIEEIVGNYRQRIFEQAGGEYWKNIFCWPDKIVEYNGKLGVVMPTYDKAFFFSSGILAGAMLSLVVLVLGKNRMEQALLSADIPKLMRKLVRRGAFESRLETLSDEIRANFYRSLDEEKNEEITGRMVQEISSQIELCLTKMAEIVEVPLG